MKAQLDHRLQPMSATVLSALGETLVVYTVLVVFVRLINPTGAGFSSVIPTLIAVASWFWLACWPAWRLDRIEGDFKRRLVFGMPRFIVCAAVLALGGFLIAHLLYTPSGDFLNSGGAAFVVVLFVLGRIVVLLASAAKEVVERRLRWQLMTSHVATVVLTFTTVTLAGSVLATALAYHLSHSNARLMAHSVAQNLELAGAPVDPRRVNSVFSKIVNKSSTLRLAGEPGLNAVIRQRVLPNVLVLLRPGGRIVAHLEHHQGEGAPTWVQLSTRNAAQIRNFRQAALHGAFSSVTLPMSSSTGFRTPGGATGFDLAASPVRNAQGRVTGVVLIEVAQPNIAASLFVRQVLTVFSLVTVLLILATSVPILGLSFLFAWFVARRFTSRLEDVSQVTTSIVSGDLSRRAPIRTRNEIGVLAGDVNRMASHLQTAMTELEDARVQAVEAFRSRQVLVAGISHELRTPLAIVRAHLEALLEHSRVPAGNHHGSDDRSGIVVPATTLGALQGETDHLASLVDDLFTLSRAETGAVQVMLRPIDMAALVEEVTALMRPLAQRERAIALSVQIHPYVPHARADPDRLRQILENLVRNAVRYTPDGGIIALGVTHEAGRVVVSVADTGEGIPAEHLPHIFEQFYRVDAARARSSGGAGLGLAIVRELVNLMGGEVTVKSVIGEGTTFFVSLPEA